MNKMKETENRTDNGNGNGSKSPEAAPDNRKELKSYKSVRKAFEMTHKRLYPELYKTKNK